MEAVKEMLYFCEKKCYYYIDWDYERSVVYENEKDSRGYDEPLFD